MENKQFQATSVTPLTAQEEVEIIRKKLKEMEEERDSIRAQLDITQVEEEPNVELTQAEKEEIDSRSVYVGNVDYLCTADEVQQHFQACGTVNRITILSDASGRPKGYAFVEFVEAESVQKALDLNESELHDRLLKVSRKRTNIPGMSQQRGRRFSGYFMPSYGGNGRFPRSKPNMRYRPY